jgi:hypothetical protein
MSLHLYGNFNLEIKPIRMIRNFTAISIITLAFAVASFFGVSLLSSKIQAQNSQQGSIRICCAWGDKLVDGILTYKIVGDGINADSTKSERAVYNAINDWNSKLHGIKLVEVSSNTKDENDNSNYNRPDLQINKFGDTEDAEW